MSEPSFFEHFKLEGNPLTKLGRFYFILIFIKIISVISSFALYLWISSVLAKFIATQNPRFLTDALYTMGIVITISFIVSLIILCSLAFLYYQAGEYSDINKMRWISILLGITAVLFLVGFPLVILGYLELASKIPYGGPIHMSEVMLMAIGSIIAGIGGLFSFIADIILIVMLFQISESLRIDFATFAAVLIILRMVFGFINGMIKVSDPTTAAAKAVISLISGVIGIAILYYLSKTFTRMGEIFENIEQNPEILENAIKELESMETPIDLRKFSRERTIPFELFIKEIRDRIIKGELKGNVIGNTYYPQKAQQSVSTSS